MSAAATTNATGDEPFVSAYAREFAAEMTRRDVNGQKRVFTEADIAKTVEASLQAISNLGKTIGDRYPVCSDCGEKRVEARAAYDARDGERQERATNLHHAAQEATARHRKMLEEGR